MGGDETHDPPWEDEFSSDARTQHDTDKTVVAVEAVPAEVSVRDTGKYKTLPSFGSTATDVQQSTAAVQSELAFGRGCAHCTKKVLMALKLRLIEGGTHPAVADEQIEKFRRWMDDPVNAELVRVAMKG
jgi:hypothetical protein